MFGFDLQLLFALLTNPVVLSVDERVVVNTFAVVFSANIAFHFS